MEPGPAPPPPAPTAPGAAEPGVPRAPRQRGAGGARRVRAGGAGRWARRGVLEKRGVGCPGGAVRGAAPRLPGWVLLAVWVLRGERRRCPWWERRSGRPWLPRRAGACWHMARPQPAVPTHAKWLVGTMGSPRRPAPDEHSQHRAPSPLPGRGGVWAPPGAEKPRGRQAAAGPAATSGCAGEGDLEPPNCGAPGQGRVLQMEPPPCCKAQLLPFQALKGSCAPQDPCQGGPARPPWHSPQVPPSPELPRGSGWVRGAPLNGSRLSSAPVPTCCKYRE